MNTKAEPVPDTAFCRVGRIEGTEVGFSSWYASSDCFHIAYDGVGDMVRAGERFVDRRDIYDFHSTFFREPDWVGRAFKSFDEIKACVDSTHAADVRDVEEMASELERRLPAPVEVKRRRVWDEFGGDEISVDRFRHAEPYFRTNARRPQIGPRLISILVQLGQNSDYSSESLKWRGAAAVALARILENAGYATEINCVVMARGTYKPLKDSSRHDARGNLVVSCSLKGAGDSLDVSALTNATSGWFFRTVCFASFGPLNRPIASGYGSMQEAGDKAAAYFARGARPWLLSGVYGQAGAVAVASDLLETLNSERG